MTCRPAKARFRHSFSPTQGVTVSASPSEVRRTIAGSARWARVIATMSAAPSSSSRAAVARWRMRPRSAMAVRPRAISRARRPCSASTASGVPIGGMVRWREN